MPIRLEEVGDRPRSSHERLDGVGGKRMGAGHHPHGRSVGAGSGQERAAWADGRPERQAVTRPERARTEATEDVGRARTDDGRDGEAARGGQIGAEPVGDTAHGDRLSGCHREGGRIDRRTVVDRHLDGLRSRPDHDHVSGGTEPQPRSGGGDLEGGRLVVVAGQAVGQPHGIGIAGAGTWHAEAGNAGAPAILDGREQPRVDDLDGPR